MQCQLFIYIVTNLFCPKSHDDHPTLGTALTSEFVGTHVRPLLMFLIVIYVVRISFINGNLSQSDVWRRLFEPNEDLSKQSTQPTTAEVPESGTKMAQKNPEPILSAAAIAARRKFIRDNFKETTVTNFRTQPQEILSRSAPALYTQHTLSHDHSNREYEQIYRPNLDIPVGNSYMTLAQ